MYVSMYLGIQYIKYTYIYVYMCFCRMDKLKKMWQVFECVCFLTVAGVYPFRSQWMSRDFVYD